jgi:hypothetical protein
VRGRAPREINGVELNRRAHGAASDCRRRQSGLNIGETAARCQPWIGKRQDGPQRGTPRRHALRAQRPTALGGHSLAKVLGKGAELETLKNAMSARFSHKARRPAEVAA